MDAAYHRAWRASHPEYRARQNELRRARRAIHGRGDRSAEYRRQRERRAVLTHEASADHPLLAQGQAIAGRYASPDRRTVLHRPTFEDAVSVAVLALLVGKDAHHAVRKFLRAERDWSAATCPLVLP